MSENPSIEEQLKDWTRTHYHAFILVWAAHSDFEVTKEEKLYIESKVGRDEYLWAEGVFANQNDYESVQFLVQGRKRFYPSEMDKVRLKSEISTLFSADHEWSTLEDNLLKAIDKVL